MTRWRGLARRIAYWTLPPGIQVIIRARARVISLGPEERAILQKNQVLRGAHSGERCFVIGNGPSLKTQDLSPLAGEVTFVTSGFWKHPIVRQWQPSYYFFADPLFFDGSDQCRKFFCDMRTRITRSTFLLPLRARQVVSTQELLPPESVRYVEFLRGQSLADGFPGYGLDLTRPVPGVINTVLLALIAALYMGCSPIYLIGLDHDWLAHRGEYQHFYSGPTITNHPKAASDLSSQPYKFFLERVFKLWESYEVLLDYVSRQNATILNATNGGFLDVFPRVDYRTVVGTSNAG